MSKIKKIINQSKSDQPKKIAQFTKAVLKLNSDIVKDVIPVNALTFHYDVVYKRYVDNLNHLILKYKISESRITNILQQSDQYPDDLIQNARGYYNHTLLFNSWIANANHNKLHGHALDLINHDFGGINLFLEKAKELSCLNDGSSWIVWAMDENKTTDLYLLKYNLSPVECNLYPLMCFDLWEHAYLDPYGLSINNYLDKIIGLTDWSYVNERIEIML